MLDQHRKLDMTVALGDLYLPDLKADEVLQVVRNLHLGDPLFCKVVPEPYDSSHLRDEVELGAIELLQVLLVDFDSLLDNLYQGFF